MSLEDELYFNWNLAPTLDPAWILLDNVYGNDREVPVHVYGMGAFCRMQLGVRTVDRVTAERIIHAREEVSKMPTALFNKMAFESYKYMGKAMLEPRLTT